jgi:multidrug transporter EmrE-like cation transporter
MTPYGWILICANSLCMASSAFLLRSCIDRAGGFLFNFKSFFTLSMQPMFMLGVVLYGLSVIGWLKIIATEKLNVAYPLLIALTFFLVTIGSIMIFKEPLGMLKVLGLILIIVGIVLITR